MSPELLSQNFMLQDMLGGGLGVLIFGVILLLTGGGIVWITNALGFRQRSGRERLAISLLVAISILPILVYWSARFAGFWLTWVTLGLLAGIGVWAFRSIRPSAAHLPLGLLSLAILWAVGVLFLISDLQFGTNRLYPSWVYGDYTVRVPITASITQGGLPPENLAYSPGQPVALFYYYFWPMLCSLVDQVGGGFVSARDAVNAGTVWIGLGLLSAFYLVLRSSPRRFKLGRFAFALILVGGLDLIPLALEGAITLFNDRTALIRNAAIFLGTTGWNHASLVETWPNAVLWVPHHMASLLAGVCAALLLTHPLPAGRRTWIMPILAGLSLASAAGYSIWVGIVFACTMLVYFIHSISPWREEELGQKQRWALLVCGSVAGLALLPFGLELASASSLSEIPLAPTIRSFDPAHRLLAAILPQAKPSLVTWLDLLLLPLNFGLEFGFACLLAWIGLRRGQHKPGALDTLLRLLFWSSLLLSSFFRSTMLNNDLAWRGILPAQFVLVVWAAQSPAANFNFWRDPSYSKLLRTVWCLALALGLGATVYDLASVRAYSLLKECLEEPDFGAVYLSLRQARQSIEELFPPGSYIQASPDVTKNFHHGLYNTHPTLIADRNSLALYHIPESDFSPLMEEILTAFANPTPRETARLCERYNLSAVLFSAWDPTWGYYQWQLTIPAVFTNDHTRLVTCAEVLQQATLP